MTAPTRLDWTDANQRLLAAEFARLKALLGDEGPGRATEELEAARKGLPGPAAIDTLAETFGLSPFEREVLLLAAGVEMDSKLAARCGEALGQPQRPWATLGLALAALRDPHWSALAPVAPLRRWRLVEVDETAGLTSARLRVDERVLHYLAGIGYLDTRLQPLLRPVSQAPIMAEGQQRIAEEIGQLLGAEDGPLPVVQLSGDDPHGQEDVAARAAERLGANLHAIAASDLPSSLHESDALTTLWLREAALSGSALLIERADGASQEVVQRFVDRIGGLVFVSGREPLQLRRPTLRYSVDRPNAPEQRQLWRVLLGAAGERLDGELDGVASQYRLSARSIAVAAAQIVPLLGNGDSPVTGAWRAVLKEGNSGFDAYAQRIEPMARWDDLILPEAQKTMLRQIASHVRHRLRVYHDWGFAGKSARGLGISALFTGESGTGKTMAAEVLARELGLELYRIDLSAVVSKYIGETEKNLRRVFDAAEESGAILLFDEADALFGKRSEVKDSHDRYANIEVSYLLQRMEAYRGLAILTTNLRTALDAAFQRRLRFVVQFPFPDQEQRELIWRGVFPAATPLEGIDHGKLARLNVAGGHIRNIALNAAFSAAAEGRPVRMQYVLQAARAEAAKREQALTETETRGWV
jgi:AAA+ superfamily predicted ATPase